MTPGIHVRYGKPCGVALFVGAVILGSLAISWPTPETMTALGAESTAPSPDTAAPKLPPLVVDKESPLLLSDASDEEDAELRGTVCAECGLLRLSWKLRAGAVSANSRRRADRMRGLPRGVFRASE